jgi:hypothetical protein
MTSENINTCACFGKTCFVDTPKSCFGEKKCVVDMPKPLWLKLEIFKHLFLLVVGATRTCWNAPTPHFFSFYFFQSFHFFKSGIFFPKIDFTLKIKHDNNFKYVGVYQIAYICLLHKLMMCIIALHAITLNSYKDYESGQYYWIICLVAHSHVIKFHLYNTFPHPSCLVSSILSFSSLCDFVHVIDFMDAKSSMR